MAPVSSLATLVTLPLEVSPRTVLRDLELEDGAVEQYIQDNRAAVESAARGKPPS